MAWLFPDFIPETIKQYLFGSLCFLFGFYGVSLVRFLGTGFSRRRQRIMTDEAFRKLDAKKLNEHLKLIGSFCNTLGAAVLGAAFIVPYIGNHASPDQVDLRWVFAELALPFTGHVALRFMKSEG